MSTTDKNDLKRHRARNISFDLNRSSPQIKEKYAKDNRARRMPVPPINPNIIDMSNTINTRNVHTGAIPKNRTDESAAAIQNIELSDELPQSVKEMVADSVDNMRRSLKHSVRDMVNESVNREMGKIHNSLSLLNDAVRALSLGQNNIQTPNAAVGNNQNPNLRQFDFPPPTIESNNRNVNRTNATQPEYSIPPPSSVPQLAPNFMPVNYYAHRARVDRFGLKFDGEETHLSVESFVFRLEYCQRQYQIPWKEILDDFHLLVTGQAMDWYWLYVETNPVSNWETLRHSLLSRFRTHRTNLDIMHELVERKQKVGESINSFFYQLNLLRSKLQQPISEFELIKLAKMNLRDNIGRIVYPIPVSSLEQLRVECVEAERHFSKRDFKIPTPPTRKYVQELDIPQDDYQISQVEEISSLVTCWNCRQTGHIFIDCPSTQRHLFCYKCGKPDVITPNCPNCKNRENQLIILGDHVF